MRNPPLHGNFIGGLGALAARWQHTYSGVRRMKSGFDREGGEAHADQPFEERGIPTQTLGDTDCQVNLKKNEFIPKENHT